MKKLFYLLLLLLLLPLKVNALEVDYSLENYFIEANIQENGDVEVSELIVLNGSFNGYYRDIIFRDTSLKSFSNSKENFAGNANIYNADNISNYEVYEVFILDRNYDFDYINKEEKNFTEVTTGSLGEDYVYEKNLSTDNLYLKMYNYNDGGRVGFLIKYNLENVVVKHNDVAEFYWKFIGSGFEDKMKNLTIKVNLPKESEELRVWAHGPLYGSVDPVNGKTLVATIENLYANTPVDVRMVFDSNIVNTTKVTNVDALTSILEVEKEKAEEANAERERVALIINIVKYFLIGYILLGLCMFYYIYIKSDKEKDIPFNSDYFRDFPGEYNPGVMSYLLNRKMVSPNDFSAAIFNLIYKKALTITKVEEKGFLKKENYELSINKTDKVLDESEEYLIDWIINNIGNGQSVTLKDIESQSKSETKAKRFMRKYNNWKEKVKELGENEMFFEDKNWKVLALPILYFVGGIITFFISIVIIIPDGFMAMLSSLVLFTSFGVLAYTIIHTRKTEKGLDHFNKWKGLKKFMLDFSNFDEKELPEIALWEKYLVFAVALGIADKVEKAMKIKLKDMNMDTNRTMFTYMYLNNSSLNNSISSTINRSISSAVASSRSSSSSGSGGGFSGGVGGGGGGGGGGF